MRIFSLPAAVVTVRGTVIVVIVHTTMHVMEGEKAAQIVVISLVSVTNVRTYVVVLLVLILLNVLGGLTAVVRTNGCCTEQ